MNATEPAGTATTSLGRELLFATRYYLGGRRGLLLLAAVAVVGGLVSSWSWLVAAGIAPLLLSVVPCVAMCALGLCMHRAAGSSQAAEKAAESQHDQRQLALDLGCLDPAVRPTPMVDRETVDRGVASCCKSK